MEKTLWGITGRAGDRKNFSKPRMIAVAFASMESVEKGFHLLAGSMGVDPLPPG
jgi:hypothetical protein